MPRSPRNTVVFDLGGVLIDWDPRHLYRKLFAGDDAAMEHFLATVCTPEWHRHHDCGRPMAENARLLKARHPDKSGLIDAFGARAAEMIGGPIADTVDILRELEGAGTPLYALSNWPAETFPLARQRFDFLAAFCGILISGEVGVGKPDRRIFELLVDRFGIDPAHSVFIDDVEANAAAARRLGFHALRFTTPAELRRELVGLGLLPAAGRSC
jgi:2-haloacid dehalogenase